MRWAISVQSKGQPAPTFRVSLPAVMQWIPCTDKPLRQRVRDVRRHWMPRNFWQIHLMRRRSPSRTGNKVNQANSIRMARPTNEGFWPFLYSSGFQPCSKDSYFFNFFFSKMLEQINYFCSVLFSAAKPNQDLWLIRAATLPSIT